MAASVLMPWYRAAPRGRAALEGLLSVVPASRLAEVNAWGGSPQLTVILLVTATLAFLDALLPLARGRAEVARGAGGALVLVGSVAAACTIFRMFDRPILDGAAAPTLREGAWLALIGACAVVLGGMWPRHALAGEFVRELGSELASLRPGALS